MNINLIEIALSIVKGIFIGIIFMILALFLVPDKLTVGILKTIKPSILNYKKSMFSKIVHIILFGSVYDKSENLIAENIKVDELENKSNHLDVLQKNLFVIDSLDGIFETLKYLGIRHGYEYSTILEETVEYVMAYANILSNTPKVDDRVYGLLDKCTTIESKFSEFRYSINLNDLEGDEYDKGLDKITEYQVHSIVAISSEIKSLKDILEGEIKKIKYDISSISSRLVEEY